MTKEEMIDRIDLVADTQRARIVGDPVRAFEYYMTELAAKKFRDSQYTGTVPELVQSWCDASNMTPKEAADDIIKEAEIFHTALAFIRRARLVGKYAVKNSTGDGSLEFNDAISKLKFF